MDIQHLRAWWRIKPDTEIVACSQAETLGILGVSGNLRVCLLRMFLVRRVVAQPHPADSTI